MTSPAEPRPAAYCVDPSCGGVAEPEQDGDHTYFECTACGYLFGFTRATQARVDACAAGIDPATRAAASAPMHAVLPATLTIGSPT